MYSIAAILLVYIKERRITPGALLIAQLSLPTIGFQLLQTQNGDVPKGWLVLIAPLLVAMGMCLGPKRAKSEVDLRELRPDISDFLKHAFWILGILAVLHFAIGGIPVFSASVETERFNLGGSGLGGFPSRAVLYAIPAMALLSLSTVTERTMKSTIAIWILYISTQLALGFKGAVLEIILLAAIAYLIRITRPKLRHIAIFALGLSAALLYVEIVRSLYATTSSGSDNVSYLIERSTTQAIESGYLALWYAPEFSTGDSAFWHDFQQLIARYVGMADSGDYTFDMLMSSIVTGTPLGVGMFIVPVTVGGTVYLMFSLEASFVVPALIAIGWIWTWAISAIRQHASIFVAILSCVAIIGLRMFLLNGNGAYLLINLAFVIVMLWICALPSWYQSDSRSDGFLRLNRAPGAMATRYSNG
ncbi:hypothetical protein [Pseudarthrobacter sp. N5]|uniref:hypothetical protein n=1 Tax=Pseudarthrobacter sp. N5 TaxID=3418416 RepID=UPI003CF22CBB